MVTDVSTDDVVIVATDGSSRGNPGAAGWAWVVSETRWECGSLTHATSIVAELTAAYRALVAIPDDVPVKMLCDSEFVVNVAMKWAAGWARRGWTTKDGKPIANKELVQALHATKTNRTGATHLSWVKGHNGHALNEAADRLAGRASAHAAKTGRGADNMLAGPGWPSVSPGDNRRQA